jgi:hypothetical protein
LFGFYAIHYVFTEAIAPSDGFGKSAALSNKKSERLSVSEPDKYSLFCKFILLVVTL